MEEEEEEESNNSSSTRRKAAAMSLWPGSYHSPVTVALSEMKTRSFERLLHPPMDEPPPTALLTRTPSETRMSILYNFSNDSALREHYRDPWNHLIVGMLLEDLDAFALTISVKHCSDDDYTTRPLYLVTASVDKIVLKKPMTVDQDLSISGAVTWVGRSSMEIQLHVTQPPTPTPTPTHILEAADDDSVALSATFIFAARDYKTQRSAPVNRLNPETEREKSLYEAGEARNQLRKTKIKISGDADRRVEALLSEGRIFCDMPALADRDTILLRETRLQNSFICHPQQRNIHSRIFGGFLMHRAFDLAFSTTYAFAGIMPSFLEVDHVDFLIPVDVGDFLRFKSCVLYTESESSDQPLIHVEVVAHVTRPELRSSEVSNRFYFTFTVRAEAKDKNNGVMIRKVVPTTEEEARRIIQRMDAASVDIHVI